jgi:hypothetical protein
MLGMEANPVRIVRVLENIRQTPDVLLLAGDVPPVLPVS